MGTREVRLVIVVILTALATALCWPGPDPTPTSTLVLATDSPAPDSPAPAVVTATSSLRNQAADDTSWLDNLSGREEQLRADDNDPHAVVVRGRLTVRQRPWLHPAGLTVRLTRSFLDTIMPTDAGVQDELAPASDDPTTTTNSEGRFAFRFAPTSGELFFLIDHGGEWMDFQRVREVPRLGGELDLGDVFIDDRGGVVGRVVFRFGRPAPGVTVRAVDDPLLGAGSELGELRAARNLGAEQFQVPGSLAIGPIPDWVVRRDHYLPFPATVTDKAGRFRLRGLRPGTHDLYLQAPFGHGRLADVQVACLRDTEIGEVRLSNPRSFRIEFEDERGRPWVGAEIAFLDDDLGFGPVATRTDARGRASAWLPAGSTYRVAFAYPGGGPWVQLGAPPRRGTLRVPRSRPLTIALVDPHQQPIVGGRVRLLVQGDAFRPVDRRLPAGLQPREREPGIHVGRTPCQVVAVAFAPGHAPAMALVHPGSRITLLMLPLTTVTVRTHDRHGQPIAGAAVRIQVHEHPAHTFPGAQWTLLANDRVLAGRTDRNGLLVVPVWDTLLSFAAEHPDFAMSPGPLRRPMAGETIDLLLRQNGTLRGQLSFHRRAAPAGFRVRARLRPPLAHELAASGWLAEALAITGEGGVFVFHNLDAGIWELQPELPTVPGVTGPKSLARSWRTKQVSLEEGQELYCELEAEQIALESPQLVGTIAIDGARLAGAVVRVRELQRAPRREVRRSPRQQSKKYRRAPGPLSHDRQASETWAQRLTTDTFGDFAFANLTPATDYEVRIDAPCQGRLQYWQRRVVRTPGQHLAQPTRLDIDLKSGWLRLWSTRLDAPFGNRMLRLRQIGDDGIDAARYEVLTTAAGECFVERLPTGNWTVEPMHGGSCEPEKFTIAAGAVATVMVRVTGR